MEYGYGWIYDIYDNEFGYTKLILDGRNRYTCITLAYEFPLESNRKYPMD